MVVIFGAALLLPFPKGRTYPAKRPTEDGPGTESRSATAIANEDSGMWTNRVRRYATRVLPPGKLLPNRQPGYSMHLWSVELFMALLVIHLRWQNWMRPSGAAAVTCRLGYG